MAAVAPVKFSPAGDFLAYSSPDGTLRIWDTATGSLKQEYTPSSHLSATCSCLSWSTSKQMHHDTPKRKKKRRSSQGETEVQKADLIGLGTTSGSILIYSTVKGDLKTQLTGGHSDTVHDIVWHPDGQTLFSCSADQHIVQWDITKGTIIQKWKGDKGSIFSLALCPNSNYLMSAGRSIKVWDIESKQLVKTYTGHASEVFQLLPVPCQSCTGATNGSEQQPTTAYCLSAAVGERMIQAWHVNLESKTKSAVASFTVPEEPQNMLIGPNVIKGQSIILGVVTHSGMLFIYEHVLNGFQKKPLQHKVKVQIVASETSTDTPKPIPVLGSSMGEDEEVTFLLSYGNFIKPTFEKLKYSSIDSNEVCLIRKDPNESVIKSESSISKVRTPEVSKDVTVLAPGHMMPSKPSQGGAEGEPVAEKRKRKKSITTELSLNDRLDAIGIDDPASSKGATAPPRADNLAVLLAQGLQSQDKKMLNHCLQQRNETIIRNTVKRLPVGVIVPLVKELSKRMHGHSQSGHVLVKWMKTVLTIHTSYLMTFPELVETLSSIYQMMDSRVSLFGRLSKLQGKLDLMLSQVTSQTEEEEEPAASQQPLLAYQDDSSDEDLDEDLLLDQSESESENNWQDDSDMEVGEDDDEDKDEDEEESEDEENGDGPNGDAEMDSDENMSDG